MAVSLTDHRINYQPVLSTTLAADYLDFENDQANIIAGRRIQQAITSRQRWPSYLSPNARKRARLSPENDLARVNEKIDPHLEISLRRNRLSLPIRIVHRLTNRDCNEPYDPDSIPVQTKRQQRKLEKRQRRLDEKIERHRLDELQNQRNKHSFDQISQQLEINERERRAQLPNAFVRRSVKEKVKDTIRKTTKIRRAKTQSIPVSTQLPDAPKYIPNIDDPEDKSQYRPPFAPADLESPPIDTIFELPPAAELPANSISPPYDFKSEFVKHHSDDGIDLDTLPPPIRSPSPCLSSIPRRGITLSQTPQPLSIKQMQCDYCHDAIKLAGFHYACTVCDDGDRLYCAKCANDGRTCRHELIERTRNIQRHPTNPQPFTHHHERRNFSMEKDSLISTDAHAELSASSPLAETNASGTVNWQSGASTTHAKSEPPADTPQGPSSPSVEVFKEFEAKRREQEVVFREKEVMLREREASLREREAWTASRERDAAFVQQLHAAAMLQRERATEVGAQFMPTPSRHPSRGTHMNYGQTDQPERQNVRPSSYAVSCHPISTPVACSIHSHQQSSPRSAQADSIKLHSSEKGKKPNIELVSAVAALEASVAGIELAEPIVRSHANSTKRKASAPETTSSSKSSMKKGQGKTERKLNKNDRKTDGDDHEESEDSEDGSPKRQKQSIADQQDQKLFACPYFKFEPMRYAEGNTQELHYRGCAGGLYRDISRVKQHLKRVHHRPDFYCRRCFIIFDSSGDLQEHSSQEEGCSAEICPFPEKLDETQQNKIHIKRPGKDPKELWYDIFKIIFPGVPVPNSPYIEAAQPKSSEQSVLEHFIRLFESKLDMSISSQPWLSSVAARDFLRTQMRQTVQETILHSSNQPSRVPSVLVSPVSPTDGSQFPESRQGSHSSRGSSSVRSADVTRAKQRPLLSPISPIVSLRPALKVTTHIASSSSESPLYSAKSQSSSQFPMVPTHIRDDLEREQDMASSSWRSGDDIHAMTGVVPEPTSATSTRSGKSVTFATPPPFVASWRETNDAAATWDSDFQRNTMPPDLTYFTNFDWSAEAFAVNNGCGQRPTIRKQRSHPVDSAYGTLSAHPSRSSIYQAQYMEPHPTQHCHSTCVDPQVLFVDPTDANLHTPGISADLQAYLNRNNQTPFGQR